MRYNYFDKISNKIVFFPGSTIGNLSEVEAIDLLASTRKVLSGNGYALIGIDLRKDVETLKKAYDDKLGVTSQFNKNLITRMNRELGTNLNPENFNHEARYCDKFHRVEMHLVSKINQTLGVSQETFKLRKGESIHTECSHKYSRKALNRWLNKLDLELKNIGRTKKTCLLSYYLRQDALCFFPDTTLTSVTIPFSSKGVPFKGFSNPNST